MQNVTESVCCLQTQNIVTKPNVELKKIYFKFYWFEFWSFDIDLISVLTVIVTIYLNLYDKIINFKLSVTKFNPNISSSISISSFDYKSCSQQIFGIGGVNWSLSLLFWGLRITIYILFIWPHPDWAGQIVNEMQIQTNSFGM